jgi:hypothetical protein
VRPLSIEADEEREVEEIEVETSPTCTWSVTSNVPWIRVLGPQTRTGSDDVRISIDENETDRERKGTLTVAGQTVTVTQEEDD